MARTKKAEAVQETAAPAELPRKMYVGPTIKGFAVQNTVYEGISDEMEERIGREPELSNLFIEIEDYPRAEESLRTRKGAVYNAYVSALKGATTQRR